MFVLAYKVQSWARSSQHQSNQQKPGAWVKSIVDGYRMTLSPIRPGRLGRFKGEFGYR